MPEIGTSGLMSEAGNGVLPHGPSHRACPDSTASDGEINGGRLYSFGLAFGAACHVSPWSAAALFKSARSSANNREEARPSL
jgi:hypothetical protein